MRTVSFLSRCFCLAGSLAGMAAATEVVVEPQGACTRKTGFVISEIMYEPAATSGLEFVEIYNSNPFEEELSGYRIEGEIDFTFPDGTVLDGESYLVVVKDAAAFQQEYSLAGVQIFEFGQAGSTGSLGRSGTLRMINSCGGRVLEIDYENDAPWPVAADGTGHSLALVRPSYGENDPQGWEISDQVGGSPGAGESYGDAALRHVVINEILAHTDDPHVDTIELYNHSNSSVDLSGCILSDEPTTNGFVIPGGTVLAAGAYVTFDEIQMGFALSSAGETLYFWNPTGSRVIDSLKYGGQENGVSIGRYPDGGAQFHRMASLTLGDANGARRIDDVVINEIMYDPISGDSDDEYVELYNQGVETIDLSGWRLRGGITFTFPSGAEISPGGFVVVARDANQLQANHPQLGASNTYGDFSGKLGNGGDLVQLDMPDIQIDNSVPSAPVTTLIHILVDEVSYETGGQWPVWAKGGGSSLERVDPRANPRRATAWADSDETGKADWTNISVTGQLEHGARGASRIEGGLQGAGECLLDDVQVTVGNVNYVDNSSFDGSLNDWAMSGSFERSSLSSNGAGGTSCLHIRSSTRCDTGANQITGSLSSSLPDGSTATIAAKAKWQKGYPWIYLRLHGNYLEAPVRLDIPANLGTPGQANSKAVANDAPTIDEVAHAPAVPSSGQAVVVTALAEDPDGLASLSLRYRVDPSTSYASVSMNDEGSSGDAMAGDGIFSATIPGQSSGKLVAFYLSATDSAGSSTRVFPGNTPANHARTRECLIRFGDATRASSFGTYRMWFTEAATTDWETRLVLSNEPVEGTFVYNDSRVIYNFGAHYVGSPFHQGWTGITDDCHYTMDMPLDDKLLGTDNFNKLHAPGNNPFQDKTMTREQAGFWAARKLKLPWLYRRYVNVYVNGVVRREGMLMEDTQVPGSEFIEQYWPNDADGNLHKANFWWEYSNVATAEGTELNKQRQPGTELLPYYNAAGELHAPRYRWNWTPRAYGDTGGNDFAPVLDLVKAANSGDDMTERMLAEADMEEWMRIWALRHAVGDLDHFGCQIAQNMYMYKPTEGRWALMIWDMNHLFGNNLSYGPGRGLLPDFSDYGNDTTLTEVYENPTFRRMYLRALKEISNGPFQGPEINQWLDVRYQAFLADGLGAGLPAMSPDATFSYSESRSGTYDGGGTAQFSGSIKDWVAEARTGILSRVAEEDTAAFALTSPSSVTSESNHVTITGTAPVELASMTVNGVLYPVTWVSVTEWKIELVAGDPSTNFELQGLDVYGNPLGGSNQTVSVTVTEDPDAAEDSVVINEILYHPAVPGDEFVELHNRSTTTAFDLTAWRLNGLGYTFPGTVLEPGGFLVIRDFDGTLDLDGEKLTLYRPTGNDGTENVVDQVRYETLDPWPATPAGSSLQLMDAGQDNRRAALWSVVDGGASPPEGETLVDWGETWKYRQGINLDDTGWQESDYDDRLWPSGPAAFGEESSSLPHPIRTPLTLGTITYYFRKTIDFTGAANASLKLTTMVDDGVVVYVDGEEIYRLRMPSGTPSYTTRTTSFVDNATEEGSIVLDVNLQPGPHVIAVELHQTSTGSSDVVFDMKVDTDYSALSTMVATPGSTNTDSYPNPDIPALWLNEVMPSPAGGMSWVELHNAGSTELSLDGYSLSDDYGELEKWPLSSGITIQPGEFLQVDLGIAALTGGSVTLSRDVEGNPELIDYLNHGALAAGWSYGDYPDGDPGSRIAMYAATPGEANTNQSAPLDALINEWMADNTSTLGDAMDGGYEDWFEIYNPGEEAIDLGGYFLTDDLTDPYQFEIPSNGKYTIPAQGFLLVWADKEPEQNEADGSALHVNFALSKNGESIGLFAADGSVIDSVTFGAQSPDQSEGRMPDGGEVLAKMESTPGALNEVINTAPILEAVADVWAYPGETVDFTVSASDAESFYQSLSFSLDPGAPTGATITPGGSFSWSIPQGAQSSESAVTIRVEDDGIPSLDDTLTFNLQVNTLPVLGSRPSLTGAGTILSIQTVSGRNYLLTYSDTLLETPWFPHGEVVPGDGSLLEWELPIAEVPRRFYRVSIEND